MEEIDEALRATVAADDGLPDDARRVRFVQYVADEVVGLKVFDFRISAGSWEEVDEHWEGRVEWMATCCAG